MTTTTKLPFLATGLSEAPSQLGGVVRAREGLLDPQPAVGARPRPTRPRLQFTQQGVHRESEVAQGPNGSGFQRGSRGPGGSCPPDGATPVHCLPTVLPDECGRGASVS